MAKSSILKAVRSVEMKDVARHPKRAQKGFPPSPPSRPVIPARVKRRRPIIAGGIIRMDLGETRNHEC
jgi:hypothetical protein